MTDDDLRARLIRLQDLLDQVGDKLWSMKLDLSRLSRSTRVNGLGSYAHAYLWLLKAMWMNGGFLPDNDRFIAGLMRLDERSWKRTYKPLLAPMLTRMPDSTFGAIFAKKRLVEIMIEAANNVLANRDRTAKATAARRRNSPAKSSQPANVTSNVTKPGGPYRDDDRDGASTSDVASTSNDKRRNKALPQVAESLIPSAPTTDAAAPPPREAEGSAAVGSPGHEGRSPPQPSERVPAPTPALLRSKLVKNGGKHDPEPSDEPDRGGGDDDQDELPEPSRARRGDAGAVGLFGALEAAIRRGKGGEGET